MKIVKKLDAGPICLQERTPIQSGEHAPALGARLASLGAELLVATLDGIELGGVPERVQDPRDATYARMLTVEDGRVNWASPAESIARRIRAFDPWPGQAAFCRTGKLKIEAGDAAPDPAPSRDPSTHSPSAGRPAASGDAMHAPPGTVLGARGNACRVACGEGTVLEALLVRPEGRRSISGAEALRGRHFAVGDQLGGSTVSGS